MLKVSNVKVGSNLQSKGVDAYIVGGNWFIEFDIFNDTTGDVPVSWRVDVGVQCKDYFIISNIFDIKGMERKHIKLVNTRPLTDTPEQYIQITYIDGWGKDIILFSESIKVQKYLTPRLDSSTFYRSDASGNKSPTEPFCTGKFYTKATLTEFGNKLLSYSIDIREPGGSWNRIALNNYVTYFHTETFRIADKVDTEIKLTLTDRLSTSEFYYKILPTFTLVNVNRSRKGIAFGKRSTGDKFECALPAEFDNTIKQNGRNLIPEFLLDSKVYNINKIGKVTIKDRLKNLCVSLFEFDDDFSQTVVDIDTGLLTDDSQVITPLFVIAMMDNGQHRYFLPWAGETYIEYFTGRRLRYKNDKGASWSGYKLKVLMFHDTYN